ncbi:MAG: response regulator [Rhodospirillales bacterium]|nr:response regulator [Rhodospirillales bacterium]MBO6787771.1 response regulator [Rhodospirillales bacterium]
MASKLPDLDISTLNFLIIEDNVYMRSILKEILRAFHVPLGQINMAEDGKNALKMLESLPTDIVLCDWEMKPMPGVEFTKRVRNSTDIVDPYVPIILITGHTEIERVRNARDHGVTEFLAKPVSPASLYERICSVVLKPRQFVRTQQYAGPDRRRHRGSDTPGDKRRKSDQEHADDKLSA